MIWDEIVIAAVSIIISSLVTWYFSRRHYGRTERPVSNHDIELEKVKGEYRLGIWVIATMLIVVVLIIGVFGYLAYTSTPQF